MGKQSKMNPGARASGYFKQEKEWVQQDRRLARGNNGRPIITPDKEGIDRYVYDDGTIDEGSTVDPRNPSIAVAGIAKNLRVRLDEANPAPDAQPEAPNEVDGASKAIGSIAVQEVVAA